MLEFLVIISDATRVMTVVLFIVCIYFLLLDSPVPVDLVGWFVAMFYLGYECDSYLADQVDKAVAKAIVDKMKGKNHE